MLWHRLTWWLLQKRLEKVLSMWLGSKFQQNMEDLAQQAAKAEAALEAIDPEKRIAKDVAKVLDASKFNTELIRRKNKKQRDASINVPYHRRMRVAKAKDTQINNSSSSTAVRIR